jgi:hypothetical protein
MIDRYLLILFVVLVLGTAGAFFLLVPILPTLVVSVMLLGMLSMFWLGLHYAARPIEASDQEDSESEVGERTLSEHAR